MTTIPEPEPLTIDRVCALCGHMESDHETIDLEDGTPARQRCVECNDWHDFVPKPEE